jgi:hypothetical protein
MKVQGTGVSGGLKFDCRLRDPRFKDLKCYDSGILIGTQKRLLEGRWLCATIGLRRRYIGIFLKYKQVSWYGKRGS